MTLSVQKLSASLQSVCLCWTNRLCVASSGPLNGRNTRRLPRSYLLSCSPATLDRHLTAAMKRKLCPLPRPPTAPGRSAFSFPFFLFLRCLFFQRQALEMGRDTPLVVSMAWIMLALLPDRVVYWCVWHSKWGIFSNLARLRAKSSFFIPYRKQKPGASERMSFSPHTPP